MKTLLIILSLAFTLMNSSNSFAGWTMLGKNARGTFYVDFERIRKNDGYLYYWQLGDFLKPAKGFLSVTVYRQLDCRLFRYKSLSYSFHKKPMGEKPSETVNHRNTEWEYPSPNSSNETIIKRVCGK